MRDQLKNLRVKKKYYDKRATKPKYNFGHLVGAYMPAKRTGPSRKFATPYIGLFKVIETYT